MIALLLLSCMSSPEISGVTPSPGTATETTVDSADTDSSQSTIVRQMPLLDGEQELYRFVVLGDFGTGEKDSQDVGALVARLEPDFIVTVGDNNYPDGEAETIDINVGQLYHPWIGNYKGKYGDGADENLFWPCPGNHDWDNPDGMLPYTEYFTLPGNERYYDFRHEDLHFFCVDSDPREPDGTDATSIQGVWLKEAMTASDAPVKIVYMHHPPYSSGSHGDNEWMQWPFLAWGADLILGGHDHIYERQMRDGVPFVTTGIGGYRTYSIRDPSPFSATSYNNTHGTTLIRVTDRAMIVETWSITDALIDQFRMRPGQRLSTAVKLVYPDQEWRFSNIEPPADWTVDGFDDSGWLVGGAPLGSLESTVWARTTFQAPPNMRDLSVEIQAAGETEVYLNGTPLVGPVSGSLSTLSLPADALVEGDNVLAFYSHTDQDTPQASVGLLGTRGTVLIDHGATWQAQISEPSARWTRPEFSELGWSSMDAPITSKDDAIWLRHTFTVENPETVSDLLLEVARADSAVVYLNGQEVHRAGMAKGDASVALSAVDADWVASPLSTLVEARNLIEGDNVLAVKVLTVGKESTGLWMDLRLTAL